MYSQLFFSKQDSNGYVLISKNNGCTYCECLNCSGKGKHLKDFWVPCYNCKGWANSYRNARGCDVCKNKEGKYESRLTKCEICAGKGQFHNTYLDDVKREKSQQEYNKKSDEESFKDEDSKYENIREIQDDEDIKKRKAYFDDIRISYRRGLRVEMDNQPPVLTKSFPSKEQIKNDLIGKKVGTWTFSKLEEFKSMLIRYAFSGGDKYFTIFIYVDLLDYITKKPYHGTFNILYDFVNNKWKIDYYDILEGNIRKSD
jgi:hypothetical protein